MVECPRRPSGPPEYAQSTSYRRHGPVSGCKRPAITISLPARFSDSQTKRILDGCSEFHELRRIDAYVSGVKHDAWRIGMLEFHPIAQADFVVIRIVIAGNLAIEIGLKMVLPHLQQHRISLPVN